jgi:cytidyltransferase-like protein
MYIIDKAVLINLHPENPNYMKGDLTPLLQREFTNDSLQKDEKAALVVVHPTGNGTFKMITGLTLGKYSPFHKGHQYLIDTALSEVDHLIIVIYNSPVANASKAESSSPGS